GVMHFHEGGWVADVLVGLGVLFLEDFQNRQIPLDSGVVTEVDAVRDDRLFVRAVAVHPTVALVEDYQRPGQVKMHQPVGQVVKVDTFAGDIRTEQHPQGAFGLAEVLYDLLLLDITHAAMQDLYGVVLEFEVTHQLAAQPVEGFDALAEDDQTVVGGALAPAELIAFQQLEQLLVFVEVGSVDIAQRQQQAVQRLNFALLIFADLGFALQALDALFY